MAANPRPLNGLSSQERARRTVTEFRLFLQLVESLTRVTAAAKNFAARLQPRRPRQTSYRALGASPSPDRHRQRRFLRHPIRRSRLGEDGRGLKQEVGMQRVPAFVPPKAEGFGIITRSANGGASGDGAVAGRTGTSASVVRLVRRPPGPQLRAAACRGRTVSLPVLLLPHAGRARHE